MKYYKIRIPLSHKDGFMKKYFDPSFSREVTFLVYKARRGDTPKKVAKRFGISADPLLDMNDVKNNNASFMPGTLVELPIPSESRSADHNHRCIASKQRHFQMPPETGSH
jgi:hypothetical protein